MARAIGRGQDRGVLVGGWTLFDALEHLLRRRRPARYHLLFHFRGGFHHEAPWVADMFPCPDPALTRSEQREIITCSYSPSLRHASPAAYPALAHVS